MTDKAETTGWGERLALAYCDTCAAVAPWALLALTAHAVAVIARGGC